MYITLNSKFKPFTYDELVKPLQDYGEAYREVEEQYSTLAQQTEAWKNIATQENSPEAYAMYKRYSDELNAVVEDFSKGMTIKNRGQLMGMKTRYASEIEPIKNAYEEMEKANAYIDEVRKVNPTAIFTTSRYNSLDDFLGGKKADNYFISGKDLESSTAAEAQAYYYTKFNELKKAGVSADKAASMLITDPKYQQEIINKALSTIDTSKFDESSLSRIVGYVANGATVGAGAFAEKEYIPASVRAQMAQAERHHQRSIAAQGATAAMQLKAQGFKQVNGDWVPDPNHPMQYNNFARDPVTKELKLDQNGNPISLIGLKTNTDTTIKYIPGIGTTITAGDYYFHEKVKSSGILNYDQMYNKVKGSKPGNPLAQQFKATYSNLSQREMDMLEFEVSYNSQGNIQEYTPRIKESYKTK